MAYMNTYYYFTIKL